MPTVTATLADTAPEKVRERPRRVWTDPELGLCAAALLLAGHAPLVVTYVQRLVVVPHYDFVPLLLVGVALLLLIRGWRVQWHVSRAAVPTTALLWGTAGLLVASLFCSPWMAMASCLLTVTLLLWFYAGQSVMRPAAGTGGAESPPDSKQSPEGTSLLNDRRPATELLPVWLLMLLALRPPLQLDSVLVTRLQTATSRTTSIVLDALGVNHLMEGNVLAVPGKRFLVEEACSGIQSVFALLAAAGFYIVVTRTPLIRAVPLLVSAVIWACLINLMRIAASIFCYDQLQLDISEGTAHEVTGLVLFFLAILFLASTDQLLLFACAPFDPRALEFWRETGNPWARFWNRLTGGELVQSLDDPAPLRAAPPPPHAVASPSQMSHGVRRGAPALAMMAIVATATGWWQIRALQAERLSANAPAAIARLTQADLPPELDGWTLEGFETVQRRADPILSDHSLLWTYRADGLGAVVSVDYPFRGWHPLATCYAGQGWDVTEYGGQTVPFESGPPRNISLLRLSKPTGENALLLFALFDDQGRALADPALDSRLVRWTRRVIERLQRPLADHLPDYAPDWAVTTQLQMLVSWTGVEPTEQQLVTIRGNFGRLYEQLVSRVQEGSSDAVREDG